MFLLLILQVQMMKIWIISNHSQIKTKESHASATPP